MDMILKRKIVKTRKPHVCFGCARKFEPHIMMERSCVIDGDKVFTCYLCSTCIDVVQDFESCDDSFGFGDLLDDALEREGAEKNG